MFVHCLRRWTNIDQTSDQIVAGTASLDLTALYIFVIISVQKKPSYVNKHAEVLSVVSYQKCINIMHFYYAFLIICIVRL